MELIEAQDPLSGHKILKGIVPVIGVINSLMSRPTATEPSTQGNIDFKVDITQLLDAVAIIGYANQELNMRRRDLIKPDLNRQFAGLCSHVPITGFLFGDDLPQQCKDIQQTNKIGHKVGLATFRGNYNMLLNKANSGEVVI